MVLVAEVDIRLIGYSSNEGRIEIKSPWNDTWGTICDDHFGDEEATVVCAMLGYNGTSRAVDSWRYPGVSFGPIYLDNVKCRGDEDSIFQCHHQGWGIHDCDHSEDACVICSNASAPTPTLIPTTGAVCRQDT